MRHRVLDVGNCDPDHGMIKRLLEQQFDAEVVRAHSQDAALVELRRQTFDLVLANCSSVNVKPNGRRSNWSRKRTASSYSGLPCVMTVNRIAASTVLNRRF